MATRYFENFPDVIYNNVRCKDITRRSIIKSGNTTSPFNFYPYELNGHLRADHIAQYYYAQPELDWLVLLANQIIDPYYGWYNTDEQVQVEVEERFVTSARAKLKVKYYRNNWADDDSQLTPDFFNNILPMQHRKYYTPLYSSGLKIVGYVRKPSDIVQNTNQIFQYEVSANNSDIPFEIGELVNFKATGTDTTIGFGEIETANSTIFRVKNVLDVVSANSTTAKDVIGDTTGANVSTANSMLWFENISPTEFVFYSPVYFYDQMIEDNETRKNINLIGDGAQSLYVNEFENLMMRGVDVDTGLVEND